MSLPLSSNLKMNHSRIQNELSAYLDNELSPSMREQVETHLRSCSECSEMLSAFQKNRQMITDSVHPAPSTLKDTVMAKIHTEFQDELSAYLDNELAPAMRERVEAHLHACNECSEMLSAFQENRQMVASIAHPAPTMLKETVMAKIHTEFQDELSAYLDNELAPAMRERVEAHLHACNECSEILTAFQKNREAIKGLEHPAPSSIKDAVMAKIREQAAKARVEEPTRTRWLPDIGQWLPDFGRWFLRPVTAGATGVLTLVLVLGALYFYPTTPQYDETLDYYFGLYTEQLEDNPLKSSVGSPLSLESLPPETIEEVEEQILDFYVEN